MVLLSPLPDPALKKMTGARIFFVGDLFDIFRIFDVFGNILK